MWGFQENGGARLWKQKKLQTLELAGPSPPRVQQVNPTTRSSALFGEDSSVSTTYSTNLKTKPLSNQRVS